MTAGCCRYIHCIFMQAQRHKKINRGCTASISAHIFHTVIQHAYILHSFNSL